MINVNMLSPHIKIRSKIVRNTWCVVSWLSKIPNKVQPSDPYLRCCFSSWLYLWTTNLALFVWTVLNFIHLVLEQPLGLNDWSCSQPRCHILFLSNLWSSSCIAMVQSWSRNKYILSHTIISSLISWWTIFKNSLRSCFWNLFWNIFLLLFLGCFCSCSARFWDLFLEIFSLFCPKQGSAAVPPVCLSLCYSSLETGSAPDLFAEHLPSCISIKSFLPRSSSNSLSYHS